MSKKTEERIISTLFWLFIISAFVGAGGNTIAIMLVGCALAFVCTVALLILVADYDSRNISNNNRNN